MPENRRMPGDNLPGGVSDPASGRRRPENTPAAGRRRYKDRQRSGFAPLAIDPSVCFTLPLLQPLLPSERPLSAAIVRKRPEPPPQLLELFDQPVDALVGLAVDGAVQKIVHQHYKRHADSPARKGIRPQPALDRIRHRLKGAARNGIRKQEQRPENEKAPGKHQHAFDQADKPIAHHHTDHGDPENKKTAARAAPPHTGTG